MKIYQGASKPLAMKLYDRKDVPHAYSAEDKVIIAISSTRNRNGLVLQVEMTYSPLKQRYEVTLTPDQTKLLKGDERYWIDGKAITSAGTAPVLPITEVEVIPGIAEEETT